MPLWIIGADIGKANDPRAVILDLEQLPGGHGVGPSSAGPLDHAIHHDAAVQIGPGQPDDPGVPDSIDGSR
jgi:hypothetical protein